MGQGLVVVGTGFGCLTHVRAARAAGWDVVALVGRNAERTARWSMNVRFKGLFTPYADKQLGDFFTPITLRPASRIGLRYQLPSGFDE